MSLLVILSQKQLAKKACNLEYGSCWTTGFELEPAWESGLAPLCYHSMEWCLYGATEQRMFSIRPQVKINFKSRFGSWRKTAETCGDTFLEYIYWEGQSDGKAFARGMGAQFVPFPGEADWMSVQCQYKLVSAAWAVAIHPPSVCSYSWENAGRWIWQFLSPGLKGADFTSAIPGLTKTPGIAQSWLR